MEDYFQAKQRLFTDATPRVAVVNVDDPYGARLASELDEPVTFALDRPAVYRGQNVETGLSGSRFAVQTPDGPVSLASPLRGRFNVYNVLGAFAAARALGVTATRPPRRSRPPGRFPAGSRRSRRASRSPSSWTTPTRLTRWRTCCARHAY